MMKKTMILALALCTAMALPGTLYAEEAAPAETAPAETTAEEQQGGLKILGEATEGGFEVLIKNSTGKDIEKIRIRSSSDEDYGDSLLKDGDIYAADEERILYYDPDSKAEEAPAQETPAPTADGEDKYLPDAYDIEITFKPETEGTEGASYELHSFPFEDIMEGEILLEGEVLYLEYKSIATDEKINTKAYEEGILTQKAAEEAGTQAASAGEAAAPVYQDNSADYSYTEPAYTEPVYTEPAYTEPAYTEPAYTEPAYTEPAYTEPAAEPAYTEPASDGGDDQCITDGLIYE